MTKGERLLMEAGPGHMVYSAKWRDRNGEAEEVHIVLPVNAADGRDQLYAAGWPGHRGNRLDYFKDDCRRFLWSLLGG